MKLEKKKYKFKNFKLTKQLYSRKRVLRDT